VLLIWPWDMFNPLEPDDGFQVDPGGE